MQMRFIKSITGKQSVEWLSETKNTICEIFLPARLKLKTLICFHSLLIFAFDRGTCYFSLWWKINNDKKHTRYWSSYPFVYHIQNRYLLGFHSICMSATRKNSALFLKFGTKLVWASFGELEVLRFYFPLVTPVVFRRAIRVWSNKTKMKRLQQAQINIKSTIFPLGTESQKI